MVKRIIFDLILLIVVITLPWWISVILAFAGLFYFEKFYEVIFVGLFIDSIYGSSVVFPDFPYLITTISALVTLFVVRFKKSLIMY